MSLDGVSEIFLQMEPSIENGSYVGVNHGFTRIFVSF